MSTQATDAMNALLRDLIRRGGNREAVVWLAAGLGNAIGRFRREPQAAAKALSNVRKDAVTLGVATRLDNIIAMIEAPSDPARQQ